VTGTPAEDGVDLQVIPAIVCQMINKIGVTLLAYLCRSPSRATVEDWATGQSRPTVDQASRLLITSHAFQIVADDQGDEVARAWLVGSDPRLPEGGPSEAIRNGDRREALSAAWHYVHDDEMGT
jgi:hypothetical protein